MIDQATALHLSNRLGFGPAPGDLGLIAGMGRDAFIDAQLHPQRGNLPQSVTAVLGSLPSFGMNSAKAYAAYWWRDQIPDPKTIPKEQKKYLKKREKQVVRDTQVARLARAVGSPWQLHEALVEFWFNHFNVYAHKGQTKVWIGAYEAEAIRPHTLGRFSDLLLATAKHPAMLVYLDNAQNVAPVTALGNNISPIRLRKKKQDGINENYAREVMELHTLGVDTGYTQSDVISLAHILTGWTVGAGAQTDAAAAAEKFGKDKGTFRFARGMHDPSRETLLGRTFSGDDVGEGEAALLMLAAHPATAYHVSFQLAQYFVADKPDAELVASMAKTFRDTGGDLRAVMRTMLSSSAFLAPSNFAVKFKTPYRYIVSAARAAGLSPAAVEPLVDILQGLGQPLYGCISPDGYACTESAWLDPNALLRRIAFATRLGAGAYGAPAMPGGEPAPLDPARIEQTVMPALDRSTLAIIAEIPRNRRAGAILGSPDFMRC
ncbi:MAG: DUF1800 domain-containing protein [Rhizomicrobium sp.]